MADLYTALVIMLAVSVAAYVAGISVGRRCSQRTSALAAVLVCAVLVVFASILRDHLALSRLLPFSALVIYGNALPPVATMLAGLTWGRARGRAWRKTFTIAPLLLLCAFHSYGFLLGAPPVLDDPWARGEVCRQTSNVSCSAAAAATLLRAHGIPATEAEMAELCLTRSSGTPMHGLYRGLKLKTADSGWEVTAFAGDEPYLRTQSTPVILSVRLDRGDDADPRYEQAWGWTPGVAHTVICFGFRPDGKLDIGDPAVGREQWRVQELRTLWHGEGIRLVRRSPPPFSPSAGRR